MLGNIISDNNHDGGTINYFTYIPQVSQGMVGQTAARRAAGIILEMVKVRGEGEVW